MEPNRERAVSVARALVHELRTEKVTFIAGSIAYHAFVSLLPLLVLVLTVLSTVGNPPEEVFVNLAAAVLTQTTSEALLEQLGPLEVTSGVSLLVGVVLVWGALRIFRGLDTAFSAIYDTESQNTITDQFTDAVVVLVTFGLAIAAAWGIHGLLDALGGPTAWLLERVVLVCGLVVTFFPMYYIFPDADVSVRETVPGLVVAAVGLVAFVSVFQFYAAYKAGGGGSLIVGILVLLTWLYFSGLIILVGAAVNAVLSNRSRDVALEPITGNHTDSDPDRERLAASLRKVAANADTGDELVITTNGSEIRLPPPQQAGVDTDAISGTDDGTIGIELRWAGEKTAEQ
jgi:membrane protein